MQADQPKRTSISEILLAIKARLIAKGGTVLNASRVKITLQDRPPKAQAEQLLWVRPGRFTSSQAFNDGAGRTATNIVRYVSVSVVTRLQTDEAESDELLLTDASRGLFTLEELAVDALHDFTPTDASENALLIEPMRILGSGDVQKDMKDVGWGAEVLTFEVSYLFAANQAEQ